MDEALQDYYKALADFRKSLSPDLQSVSFDPLQSLTTADDAIAAGRDLDSTLVSVLDRRHFAKAHPVLKKRVEDLQKYAPVIDTFVSSDPLVAALVWGSIKLVLQNILQFLNPYEKIFDAFGDMVNTLPRIEIYQQYATELPSIKAALNKFNINLVKFFSASLRFLKRHGFRALVASFTGNLDPNFEQISHLLKEDAHQLDLLVSAVAFDAASKERFRSSRRAFFQWLNEGQENDKTYEFAKSQVHPGTCNWIKDTKEYRKWEKGLESDFVARGEDDPCPVLEVQGQEGCGKTVLASWLVQVLNEHCEGTKSAVLYYFSNSDDITFSCRPLLANLIAQILRNHKALWGADVQEQFEESCTTVASEDECFEILRSLVQNFDSIVILVDSRWSNNFQLYKMIYELMGKEILEPPVSPRMPRANGSQPGTLLKAVFFERTDSWPRWWKPESTETLQLDQSVQAQDKRSFVSSQVQNISSLHFEPHGLEWLALNEKIETQLCREPIAPFLLLKLIVEYLKVQISPRDVELALNSLAPDVRSIYLKAFIRIQDLGDSRTQLGYNVLQWAAFALRSLHISEPTEAVIVQIGVRTLDPAKKPSRFENQIRQICGPFIAISDGFVYLSHVSAKYFLQDVVNDGSKPEADVLTLKRVPRHLGTPRGYNPTGFETVSRNRIARACIAYLSLDEFSQLPSSDESKLTEVHPLLEYTVHCWLHHILLLADILKNREKGYRPELVIDKELLEHVSLFLSLPQSWTYLQSLVVFSSVREALETLRSHMWPVRELGPVIRETEGIIQKSLESDEASAMEQWMKKAIQRLELVQDLPSDVALNELKN